MRLLSIIGYFPTELYFSFWATLACFLLLDFCSVLFFMSFKLLLFYICKMLVQCMTMSYSHTKAFVSEVFLPLYSSVLQDLFYQNLWKRSYVMKLFYLP